MNKAASSDDASGDLFEGDTLVAHRYRVVCYRGDRGFGQVYEALDSATERRVALMRLSREFSRPEARDSFFDTRSTAAVEDPRIVDLCDYGEDVDGRLFLVMPWVEDAVALDDLLAREGALAWPRAKAIIAQIAGGLEAAHRKGVLHGGLEPSRVLIDPRDGVHIVDFGLAPALVPNHGAAGFGRSQAIQTGPLPGRAEYLSPEQIRGAAVDARSDIYALGVILWELISGLPPFAGDPITIAGAHLDAPLPELARLRPSNGAQAWAPPELEPLLHLALTKDPNERLASAGEFLSLLEAINHAEPSSAPPPRQLAKPALARAPARAPARPASPPPAARKPAQPPAAKKAAPPPVAKKSAPPAAKKTAPPPAAKKAAPPPAAKKAAPVRTQTQIQTQTTAPAAAQPSAQPTPAPSIQPSPPPSVPPSAPPPSQPSAPPSTQPSAPPSSQPSAPPSTQPSAPPAPRSSDPSVDGIPELLGADGEPSTPARHPAPAPRKRRLGKLELAILVFLGFDLLLFASWKLLFSDAGPTEQEATVAIQRDDAGSAPTPNTPAEPAPSPEQPDAEQPDAVAEPAQDQPAEIVPALTVAQALAANNPREPIAPGPVRPMGQSLTDKNFREAMVAGRDEILDKCLDSRMRRTLKVALKVAPSGKVEYARVLGNLSDTALGQCVVKRVYRIEFPPTYEGGTHTYTLRLR